VVRAEAAAEMLPLVNGKIQICLRAPDPRSPYIFIACHPVMPSYIILTPPPIKLAQSEKRSNWQVVLNKKNILLFGEVYNRLSQKRVML
jgi:hypothetical protein